VLGAERGLRPNTLAAYRRDLRAYAGFYARSTSTIRLPSMRASCSSTSQPSSGHGRRTTIGATHPRRSHAWSLPFRSFHRFCVDEGAATRDPTDDVRGPRVPLGIPKALDRIEVEHLLDAVVGDGPGRCGIARFSRRSMRRECASASSSVSTAPTCRSRVAWCASSGKAPRSASSRSGGPHAQPSTSTSPALGRCSREPLVGQARKPCS